MMSPLQRAERVGALMYADDATSQSLGLELLGIGPGTASMRLHVKPTMTNGLGICHGGFIFLLADTTFAYACNSQNLRSVAASAQIDFLGPAQRGEVLTAIGVEQHRASRSGVYDIRVTNQADALIALFRGKSAVIKGHVFEEIE